jgi:GNAT superfamily N-acetyltransferase
VKISILDTRPDLMEQLLELNDRSWPVFMHHGNARHWSSLYSAFSSYQILFTETDSSLCAAGLTVPSYWNGKAKDLPPSIDSVLYEANRPGGESPPEYLCAMAAIVRPDARGRGLSRRIVQEMLALSRRKGLRGLMAPVRPTKKADHPSVSMEDYLEWLLPDGAHYDPWIRTHDRLGGRRLSVAPKAYEVEGTVAEWEEWTGQKFERSGYHVVRGALSQVLFDLEADNGHYIEANVWYLHEAKANLGKASNP